MNKDISKALPRPPDTNILEIAVNKAYTIGRRATWRDYVDMFFILKKGLLLENIIKDAKTRFEGNFDGKLFLEQLVYFEDIKDFTITYLDKEFSPKEIKLFFEKKIEEYLNKTLK